MIQKEESKLGKQFYESVDKVITMKKQTAVEWLFAHLLPFLSFSDDKEREHFRKCLAEAKVMEREQIIEAFYQCGKDNFEHIKVINRSATDYYNETYNGGEQ